MRRVDGIQIGERIMRYGPGVFQTEGGTLLKFVSDAQMWEGVFPGCSWDRFYDEVLPQLCGDDINILAVKQRRIVPTIIRGRNIGACCRCSTDTSYKFCSVSCWFFNTIELTKNSIAEANHTDKVNRQVAFVERMVEMFADQVDEEQFSLTQL